MNRLHAAKVLPYIKAYAENKDVQFRINTQSAWKTGIDLSFNSEDTEYRIKPTTVKVKLFKYQDEHIAAVQESSWSLVGQAVPVSDVYELEVKE